MDCKKLVALSCQLMSLVATVVAQDARRSPSDVSSDQQVPSLEINRLLKDQEVPDIDKNQEDNSDTRDSGFLIW